MNIHVTAERDLSKREIEIVRWLAEGKSADEIGVVLGIATYTVRSHVSNCMRALNVHKDTALVAAAFRKGLIA